MEFFSFALVGVGRVENCRSDKSVVKKRGRWWMMMRTSIHITYQHAIVTLKSYDGFG